MNIENQEQINILQEEQSNYDWLRKRQSNYPQFSEEDIGHLYDSIQAILDILEENDIIVSLKDNTKARLEHRALIKTAIPKE
jgi:hypothetical protein